MPLYAMRLREKKMAGLARIVLYRRERPVVIEALGKGMLLTTLRYDHTVRQPETVFDEIGKVSVDQEMTDLAAHIIDKKKGKFDPSKFDDRYEDALLALDQGQEGREKTARRFRGRASLQCRQPVRCAQEEPGIGGRQPVWASRRANHPRHGEKTVKKSLGRPQAVIG